MYLIKSTYSEIMLVVILLLISLSWKGRAKESGPNSRLQLKLQELVHRLKSSSNTWTKDRESEAYVCSNLHGSRVPDVRIPRP